MTSLQDDPVSPEMGVGDGLEEHVRSGLAALQGGGEPEVGLWIEN